MNLAVPHVVRNWQMQEALAFNFPPLLQQPARDDVLSIVGYGPSLLETWRQIRAPILTLSGAHGFLLERQVVPTWHADCDPRVHKSTFVAHPHPQVVYLMASCCHPQTWHYLLRSRVQLWHADNGPETQAWLAEYRPRGAVFEPGPSIGTAALRGLARLLGFRRVRCFGFDSCYDGEQLRAGWSDAPYSGETPQVLTVNGVTYVTTEGMRLQAERFLEAVDGLEYELVGDGLLRAIVEQQTKGADMARDKKKPQVRKPAAPKRAQSTEAAAPEQLEAGTRITYTNPQGGVHGGAILVHHADGAADLALDNGREVKGAPRAKEPGDKGSWATA